MSGLGGSSVGSMPFGSGTPVDASAPPESPLSVARFLNPVTKDYELADDGEYRGMPTVRHRALMLLSTTLTSATGIPEAGLQLPLRIDGRYPQKAAEKIRLALDPLISANELRIDRIDTDTSLGRAEHIVSFTDLTTGNPGTLTV